MFSFFHDWRRKMGAATLVMACAFMSIWMRSLWVSDAVQVRSGEHGCVVASIDSRLVVFTPLVLIWGNSWINWRTAPAETSFDPTGDKDLIWRWDFLGFHISESEITFFEARVQVRAVCLPYWSVVTPLTMLSIWLLLKKARWRPNHSEPAKLSE